MAWTLGRVCEMLPDVVLQDSPPPQTPMEGPPYSFQQLLEALVANLKAEPRVAANVCWVSISAPLHLLNKFFCVLLCNSQKIHYLSTAEVLIEC